MWITTYRNDPNRKKVIWDSYSSGIFLLTKLMLTASKG